MTAPAAGPPTAAGADVGEAGEGDDVVYDGESGGDRAEPLHLHLVRAEPGAAAEGVIELGWPLRGNHPYFAPGDLPVRLPDPVETVRLCLGVEPLTPANDGAPVVQEGDAAWLDVPMDQLSGTPCTEPAAVGYR